ncbi:hypothetical protein GCM10009743_17310 [Kribbella swartbergensis]
MHRQYPGRTPAMLVVVESWRRPRRTHRVAAGLGVGEAGVQEVELSRIAGELEGLAVGRGGFGGSVLGAE